MESDSICAQRVPGGRATLPLDGLSGRSETPNGMGRRANCAARIAPHELGAPWMEDASIGSDTPPGVDGSDAPGSLASVAAEGWLLRLAACGTVALGTIVLALPPVLASWQLTPDAVDYLGIAHSWIEGRGFVVPVVYSYYLPELQPPAPALAVRAPVVPILFSIPMALGAGLTTIAVLHVIWSACIGAGVCLLAQRWMRLSAAFACGIAVAWSFAWVLLAQQLLTEMTSVAAAGVTIAFASRGTRSVGAALVLAGIVFVAWLTRPNLGVLLPAVLLARTLELGPTLALRSAPLWVLVVGFVGLQQGYSLLVSSITGYAPYEHYGMMAEILLETDASRFQTEYVGVLAFLRAHASEVGTHVLGNVGRFVSVTAGSSYYHYGGVFAIPAVLYGLLRRGPSRAELQLVALATLAVTATAAIGYGGYDPLRYPLLTMVGVWILSLAMLSDLCDRLTARIGSGSGWLGRALPLAPLGLVVLVLLAGLPATADWTLRSWSSYREVGTLHRIAPTGLARDEWSVQAAGLCDEIDPDSIVAAHDPWTLHVFCGNAAYWLPPDLSDESWVARYLSQKTPGYVIEDGSARFAAVRGSPSLEKVAARGRFSLFRVRDASPESRPWQAPPPLAALGVASAPTRNARQ